uniref:Acyl-CoA dehydrogenase n=1 Tax=Paramoeba aestuarina TaxID=180227 RepID=A0A7S4P207_9EUKA|mmetsp:Transcript_34896/g.54381  ORF Transcript_34896/g.54381 Transcript_34896/m.54381 type:complete len:417 (+) Transcript_34896:173-1423(+)|eukprot:CAMPEP_0201515122 /NCGR_PEP_ID=MMETSP0161_2-20130828/6776_1 /ASSEMBLY_ACC=CAM_ASM_000251 /TAXON_ID=180227 /ORGANISM="Neoparamoeba aestuarina, Strain SoJaBio B1-5/56/2" /LENGTH=416 /DNA_ID=CAMNT_0047911859 /DNA_START=82 /DNA_END=1332 /DNA_ORIENTATION=+
MPKFERFGNQIPFCEPAWYQGHHTPYYTEKHVQFRARVREFVEKEMKPNIDKWIKTGYPKSLHEEIYKTGLGAILYPKEYGGQRPDDFDAFYEVIMIDEMARCGGGGVLGQGGINSMALPPIMNFGSDYLKELVLRPVITGKKACCLAISESGAGSDVANIETTAERDGDFFVVNGHKKWITGGLFGDFFTTAVRTGGEGMGGISLLLIERDTPGVNVRKMETQFDNAHNTTFITFDNVRVPAKNLIGEEGQGFFYIVHNFNHERLVISISAARMSRLCYEEAIKYALKRKTFGKTLVQHQLVRFKLAEMARQIESLHDFVERTAYQFASGVPDAKLGGQCALLKVQASKTFEFCSREASQIFGGSSIVKEGQGKLVERMAREVRAQAIPGGSEEILLDFTIRDAVAKAKRLNSKL